MDETSFLFAPTDKEIDPEIVQKLVVHTLEGKWDEVVSLYEANGWTHEEKINGSQDTALHIAVDNGQERTVAQLVGIIIRHDKSALEIPNARGDTPLHLAASRGFANICYCIVGKEKERVHLLRLRNKQGEMPLFLAALNWHKDAFLYLHHCFSPSGPSLSDLTRDNGDTILHCAISREYFDLAVIIIHNHKDLVGYANNKITPLKLLATRPLAFRRSSSNLGWLNKLLYHCILVEQVDVETYKNLPHESTFEIDLSDPKLKSYPENYETCYNFFTTLTKIAASLFGFFREKQAAGDTENPKTQLGNLPPNYATFSDTLKSAYILAAGLSGIGLLRVKRMKEKHVWSAQVLDLLMEAPIEAYSGSGGQPLRGGDISNQEILSAPTQKQKTKDHDLARQESKKDNSKDQEDKKDNSKDKKDNKDGVEDKIDLDDSPLLIAARNGILEMVDKILDRIPMVIHDTTSKHKRNILLAAIESRQPLVVETLRKSNQKLWDNLILGVDKDENTALHLAARQSTYRAWEIPGSAMQMLWDIKWYQYVKDLVPHHFHLRNNNCGQTPPEIFKEKHDMLVKEGSDWLKETSESCSVVAALIAGVAFATSSAVPGGNNEETGKPNYEGQPAFNVFAITSLVALCFSVTALIMFLAILTTRKQAKDFRRDLPFKLLLGLSSLFISIASMLVSFCAAHFFVVRDKFKDILFPIYAATCLPVTFYAIAQFPLYVDLLISIVTKVPRPSHKGSDL